MWWMFCVFNANMEDKLQLSQTTQSCLRDWEHKFLGINMKTVRMDHLKV